MKKYDHLIFSFVISGLDCEQGSATHLFTKNSLDDLEPIYNLLESEKFEKFIDERYKGEVDSTDV